MAPSDWSLETLMSSTATNAERRDADAEHAGAPFGSGHLAPERYSIYDLHSIYDVPIFGLESTLGLEGAFGDDCDSIAYVWNLENDSIEWEADTELVLGVTQNEKITTGEGFFSFVAPEHVLRRREFFLSSEHEVPVGHAVPYRLQFRILPKGDRSSESIWIEESGRWWGDKDGKPLQARGVMRVVSEGTRRQQEEFYGADFDDLTRQLSRRRLMEALDAMIERAAAERETCGLMLVTIDNMSTINEAFGFEVGDAVITSVGSILQDRMRGGDAIGRYSGNKFGVVLSRCDSDEMHSVAQRLIRAVLDADLQGGVCPLAATISIGGVLIPEVVNTAHQAVFGALQAMETAKSHPQARFVMYKADPIKISQRRRNIVIADEVMSALNEDRMRLALQPVVDSKTGKPAFYEALVRMKMPNGTVVSASEFVEDAERLGFSRRIDLCTLKMAVNILRDNPDVRLALNVSALTCGDQEWLLQLQSLSNGYADLRKRLTIEITETAAIADLNQAITFVDSLKELGCLVALDDFGAGHTSFSHLKHLSVDIVKIDGSFIRDLTTESSNVAFLEVMGQLAHSLGMQTVAEWVCSEATANIVRDAGITFMQGFHYGSSEWMWDGERGLVKENSVGGTAGDANRFDANAMTYGSLNGGVRALSSKQKVSFL